MLITTIKFLATSLSMRLGLCVARLVGLNFLLRTGTASPCGEASLDAK